MSLFGWLLRRLLVGFKVLVLLFHVWNALIGAGMRIPGVSTYIVSADLHCNVVPCWRACGSLLVAKRVPSLIRRVGDTSIWQTNLFQEEFIIVGRVSYS